MSDPSSLVDAQLWLFAEEGGDLIAPHEASETWSRLLALDEGRLRDSIRACERYLVSPDGIADFRLVERVPDAECAQIFDEALRRCEMMRSGEGS